MAIFHHWKLQNLVHYKAVFLVQANVLKDMDNLGYEGKGTLCS